MEQTHLGRSGLSVSRLCLGTMNFGPETAEPDVHAIMDRAHAEGVHFFDTANVYGFAAGRPPATGTPPAWSASSRSTTCWSATSSARSCRPPSTTASASSRGARCRAACSPGCWPTMEQFESSLSAVEITLDDAQLAALDDVFPGHETAPEDYAW